MICDIGESDQHAVAERGDQLVADVGGDGVLTAWQARSAAWVNHAEAGVGDLGLATPGGARLGGRDGRSPVGPAEQHPPAVQPVQ